jgi:hypothetical protein
MAIVPGHFVASSITRDSVDLMSVPFRERVGTINIGTGDLQSEQTIENKDLVAADRIIAIELANFHRYSWDET